MKITIRNFQKKIPINPKRIKKTILKVLSKENARKSGEIAVCFVNDKEIKEINWKYLRRNTSTDVLTFNLGLSKQSNQMLADIIISTDTAVRNAKIFKTTPLFEVYLYVVHGMLHLLGYNDKTRKQIKIMTTRTETILFTLNKIICPSIRLKQ